MRNKHETLPASSASAPAESASSAVENEIVEASIEPEVQVEEAQGGDVVLHEEEKNENVDLPEEAKSNTSDDYAPINYSPIGQGEADYGPPDDEMPDKAGNWKTFQEYQDAEEEAQKKIAEMYYLSNHIFLPKEGQDEN